MAAALRRMGVDAAPRLHRGGARAGGDAVLAVRDAQRPGVGAAGRQGSGDGRPPAAAPKAGGWRRWRSTWTGALVRIDDQCRTSMRDVWAIGDVTGEPMLAHRAMAQGAMVAEIIAGARRASYPAAIPAVCFTDPEWSSSACTPAEREAGGSRLHQRRAFPFAGQRPRDDAGSERRLRARRRAPRRPPDPRLPGGRPRRLGAVRGVRSLRSKWARGSRTSPAPSTPTRRSAKRCRKRRCARSGAHCTCRASGQRPGRDERRARRHAREPDRHAARGRAPPSGACVTRV